MPAWTLKVQHYVDLLIQAACSAPNTWVVLPGYYGIRVRKNSEGLFETWSQKTATTYPRKHNPEGIRSYLVGKLISTLSGLSEQERAKVFALWDTWAESVAQPTIPKDSNALVGKFREVVQQFEDRTFSSDPLDEVSSKVREQLRQIVLEAENKEGGGD